MEDESYDNKFVQNRGAFGRDFASKTGEHRGLGVINTDDAHPNVDQMSATHLKRPDITATSGRNTGYESVGNPNQDVIQHADVHVRTQNPDNPDLYMGRS